MIRSSLIVAAILCGSSVYASWSKSVSSSYSTDLRGDNPIASFSGNFGYQLNEKTNLSVSQSITQKFFIYPDEDEFQLADTVLSASYTVGEYYSLNHSVSISMSLPISETSRDNDKYTNVGINWSASHSPLEKLNLSYGLFSRAYFSEYQSEISGDGLGGSPLPIYSTGLRHGGNYQIIESLGINYQISNSRIKYYDLSPEESGLVSSDVPNDVYSASLGVSWRMNEKLNLSTGFSKGNLITQIDTLDFAIFDAELSQWYISLSLRF